MKTLVLEILAVTIQLLKLVTETNQQLLLSSESRNSLDYNNLTTMVELDSCPTL